MPQTKEYVDRTPEKLLIAALSILIIVASVISYFFIVGERMSVSPPKHSAEIKMAIARVDGKDVFFSQKPGEKLVVNASMFEGEVKFALVVDALGVLKDGCNINELHVELLTITSSSSKDLFVKNVEKAQLTGASFKDNIIGRKLVLKHDEKDKQDDCAVIGVDLIEEPSTP